MILFIDTSDHNGARFALIPEPADKSGKLAESRHELAFNENYKTLELLEKFLRRNKIAKKQLTKIIACSGPGSFTGIRVGIALAQGFGIALNIPIAIVSKDKIPDDLSKLAKIKGSTKLVVAYGQEPNITKSKKS